MHWTLRFQVWQFYFCCPPEWFEHSFSSEQISWFARSRLLGTVYFSRLTMRHRMHHSRSHPPFARTPSTYTQHTNETHTRTNWWNLSTEWSRFRLYVTLSDVLVCECCIHVSVFSSYTRFHTHTHTYTYNLNFRRTFSYNLHFFSVVSNWFNFLIFLRIILPYGYFISLINTEFQRFSLYRINFMLIIKVATSSAWINSARNVNSTKIEGKCMRPIDISFLLSVVAKRRALFGWYVCVCVCVCVHFYVYVFMSSFTVSRLKLHTTLFCSAMLLCDIGKIQC